MAAMEQEGDDVKTRTVKVEDEQREVLSVTRTQEAVAWTTLLDVEEDGRILDGRMRNLHKETLTHTQLNALMTRVQRSPEAIKCAREELKLVAGLRCDIMAQLPPTDALAKLVRLRMFGRGLAYNTVRKAMLEEETMDVQILHRERERAVRMPVLTNVAFFVYGRGMGDNLHHMGEEYTQSWSARSACVPKIVAGKAVKVDVYRSRAAVHLMRALVYAFACGNFPYSEHGFEDDVRKVPLAPSGLPNGHSEFYGRDYAYLGVRAGRAARKCWALSVIQPMAFTLGARLVRDNEWSRTRALLALVRVNDLADVTGYESLLHAHAAQAMRLAGADPRGATMSNMVRASQAVAAIYIEHHLRAFATRCTVECLVYVSMRQLMGIQHMTAIYGGEYHEKAQEYADKHAFVDRMLYACALVHFITEVQSALLAQYAADPLQTRGDLLWRRLNTLLSDRMDTSVLGANSGRIGRIRAAIGQRAFGHSDIELDEDVVRANTLGDTQSNQDLLEFLSDIEQSVSGMVFVASANDGTGGTVRFPGQECGIPQAYVSLAAQSCLLNPDCPFNSDGALVVDTGTSIATTSAKNPAFPATFVAEPYLRVERATADVGLLPQGTNEDARNGKKPAVQRLFQGTDVERTRARESEGREVMRAYRTISQHDEYTEAKRCVYCNAGPGDHAPLHPLSCTHHYVHARCFDDMLRQNQERDVCFAVCPKCQFAPVRMRTTVVEDRNGYSPDWCIRCMEVDDDWYVLHQAERQHIVCPARIDAILPDGKGAGIIRARAFEPPSTIFAQYPSSMQRGAGDPFPSSVPRCIVVPFRRRPGASNETVTYELVSVYATPYDSANHYIGRARDTSDGLEDREFVYRGMPKTVRTSETWFQFNDAMVHRVMEVGSTGERTNPIARELNPISATCTEKFETPYANNSFMLSKSAVTIYAQAFVYARTRGHEKASSYAKYEPDDFQQLRAAPPAAIIAVTISRAAQFSAFRETDSSQRVTRRYTVIVCRPRDARGFLDQAIEHINTHSK